MSYVQLLTDFLNSPYFGMSLTFLAGWAAPQMAVARKAWAYVMGASAAIDQAQEYVKIVDATLKAHGVIPKDGEVPSVQTMAAVGLLDVNKLKK